MKKISLLAILTIYLSFSNLTNAQKGNGIIIPRKYSNAPVPSGDKSIGDLSEKFRKTYAVYVSAKARDTIKDSYNLEKLNLQMQIQNLAIDLARIASTTADHIALMHVVELHWRDMPQEVTNDYLLVDKKKTTTNKKNRDAKAVYDMLVDMNELNHQYNRTLSGNSLNLSALTWVSKQIKSFRFEENKNLPNTLGFTCSSDTLGKSGVKFVGRAELVKPLSEYTDYNVFCLYYYLLNSSDYNYIGNWNQEDNDRLEKLKPVCPSGLQIGIDSALAFVNSQISSFSLEMNGAGEIAGVFNLKKDSKEGYTRCQQPLIQTYLLNATDHNYIGNLSPEEVSKFRERLKSLLCTTNFVNMSASVGKK